MSITITTASGATITATTEAMASGKVRVIITQDGALVGEGWVEGGHIVDCAARLGAVDGSETDDAYAALDAGILEGWASDIGQTLAVP